MLKRSYIHKVDVTFPANILVGTFPPHLLMYFDEFAEVDMMMEAVLESLSALCVISSFTQEAL